MRIILLILLLTIPRMGMAQTPLATLTWDTSTDNPGGSGVAVYNIYRCDCACETPGPFQKIGQTKTTTYQDVTRPASGVAALCYEVAALDLAQNESARSVRVGKAITPQLVIAVPEFFVYAGEQFSWQAVPNAAGYQLFAHLDGTPYDCAVMVCATITGDHYPVALSVGRKYDSWIIARGPNGEESEARGLGFVVQADSTHVEAGGTSRGGALVGGQGEGIVVPPSSDLREALLRGLDACIKNTKRTVLKCFQGLRDALKEAR